MRQRNVKNLQERLDALAAYRVSEPERMKGNWSALFANDNPIFAEIGCGKGQFLNAQAALHPACNFIGIEGQENVILRALEKSGQAETTNVLYISKFVNDISEIFAEGELSGIYLNFSDPWPKERHARRRLTHLTRLQRYFKVLKAGCTIEIKTDNDDLFAFTLQQIEEGGFTIEQITHDLHASAFAAKDITTEYEDKFSQQGKTINYVKIRA